MTDRKRILIAPLDWGLGHAARCIPIIRYLHEKGAEVIIAADHRPLALLQAELKDIDVQFIRFPGYEITYPEKGSMTMKMLRSAPRILRGIEEEHKMLEDVIAKHNIHAVISDNRFGLWSRKVPCVFITHQLMIKSPVGENILHKLNARYIKKYNECWVPDIEGENNLSGDLSHKYELPANAHYIGPLTRFDIKKEFQANENNGRYDIVAIISGPEPQRTLFEQMLTMQRSMKVNILMVTGKPEDPDTAVTTGMIIYPHLGTNELHEAIASAPLVISRPGYSTIMDLAALGKKAIFVPTPGQTEQEYLGELMMKRGIAYCVSQEKFNLTEALEESKKYTGFTAKVDTELFKKRVDALLERL